MTDVVNTGTSANSGNGDPLRTAFQAINAKFVAQDADITERFNQAGMLLVNRGAWAPSTAYEATPQREWVVNGGQAYVVTSNHVSGASFATDLASGKWLAADVAQLITDLAASSGSNLVGFKQSGTGAVPATVQSKLRESVSVKDFGAVGDGVVDDTAAIQAAFDYAIPLSIPVKMDGHYLVSGPIQPYAARASGGLHIVCNGNVRITVNPAAAGFSDLLYFHTTAYNSASIVGGMLAIDGSNKAGRGITIRHDDAIGGSVIINARLQITSILETNAAATRENAALAIIGRYRNVVVNHPFVQDVSRTNAAGATKGISVSSLSGTCTINQPHVENVLCVSSANTDADGIAVFGYQAGGANSARQGSLVINDPTFVNCQGRSFKGQISDAAIYRPRVKRTGAVVAIAQGCDFDFQLSGDALLHEPVYEYYETTGVSPFSVAGSSFSSVSFQQTLDDREMSGRSVGGTMYTQVQLPRYCLMVPSATAKRSIVDVDGLKIIPVGSFASSAFSRAVLEFNMGTVATKTEKTKVIVKKVEGPFTNISAIGYTGYTSGAINTKFSYQVSDCASTLSGTLSKPFNALSGTAVGEVESFMIRDNYRFRDLIAAANAVFSFAKLVPGCKFTVDLSTMGTVTNAPAWGASGYATVECLQQWFSESDVVAKVHVGNATAANSVFYTQSGGTTWGTIK